MGVPHGGRWTGVPGEPLRQEEVSRRPIGARDRRVPQRVEGVEPVEPGDDLPGAEEDPDPALG